MSIQQDPERLAAYLGELEAHCSQRKNGVLSKTWLRTWDGRVKEVHIDAGPDYEAFAQTFLKPDSKIKITAAQCRAFLEKAKAYQAKQLAAHESVRAAVEGRYKDKGANRDDEASSSDEPSGRAARQVNGADVASRLIGRSGAHVVVHGDMIVHIH